MRAHNFYIVNMHSLPSIIYTYECQTDATINLAFDNLCNYKQNILLK